MPSPFPGMDPYLEREAGTGDFRHRFVVHWSGELNQILPDGFVSRICEREYPVDGDFMLPARLQEKPAESSARRQGCIWGRIANMEFLDPYRELYLEILEIASGTAVTVLEFLSPANKNGGRGQYLEHRQMLLKRPVNIVEVDLIRAGVRPVFEYQFTQNSYCFLLSRINDRPWTEICEWTVRDSVPPLPIPLNDSNPELQFDLGAHVRRVRESGYCDEMIDYTERPPGPAFATDDAEWVAEKARAAIKQKDPGHA